MLERMTKHLSGTTARSSTEVPTVPLPHELGVSVHSLAMCSESKNERNHLVDMTAFCEIIIMKPRITTVVGLFWARECAPFRTLTAKTMLSWPTSFASEPRAPVHPCGHFL